MATRCLASSIFGTCGAPRGASRWPSCRDMQLGFAVQPALVAAPRCRHPAATARSRSASRATSATLEVSRLSVDGPSAAVASLAAGGPSSPEPRQWPLSPDAALAASLRRITLRWTDLLPPPVAAAAAADGAAEVTEDDDDEGCWVQLQRQRLLLEGSAALESYRHALEEGGLATSCDFSLDSKVEATLEEWQAGAHQRPPGFDREARLELAGLAEAAVVTRGGRMHGCWKAANQDAFSLTAPAPRTLLLSVCDGHGTGGEWASQAAAEGVAAALPAVLGKPSSSGDGSSASSNGSGSSSSGSADEPVPSSQQALVAAFLTAARRMERDPAFRECGAAVAACLLEPGSLTVAWAGDCRAVVGLSVSTVDGPRCLVRALTKDHKPSSPLERARIAATGRGRLVRAHASRPYRLTGFATTNTLSLSRGFGDTWASLLGLTPEPDAVTLQLPLPTAAPAPAAGGGRDAAAASHEAAGGSDASACAATSSALDSLTSSSDSDSDVEASCRSGSRSGSAGVEPSGAGTGAEGAAAPPARHVVVLACDGLWDMLPNAEAVSIALSCSTAEEAAHAVVRAARHRWAAVHRGLHMDDITAAVAFLPA